MKKLGKFVLFLQGWQKQKKGECIRNISKKRLHELSLIKDSEIDTSDIPERHDSFWKNATLHLPEPKIAIL